MIFSKGGIERCQNSTEHGQPVLINRCLKPTGYLHETGWMLKELQGLNAKKLKEGNSGPNADTGKKPQRNGKGDKKNAQFQYFFGNIFFHSFIFTHKCDPI